MRRGVAAAAAAAILTRAPAPGLTKIATDNQPASIVRELEEMSRAYIRPKVRRRLVDEEWNEYSRRVSC